MSSEIEESSSRIYEVCACIKSNPSKRTKHLSHKNENIKLHGCGKDETKTGTVKISRFKKKTPEDAERFGKRAGKAALVFGKSTCIDFRDWFLLTTSKYPTSPNTSQKVTKARVLRVFSIAEMATATAHGEPLNPPNPT